jgi:pimeloyl-ACP methyl ester carboxylesterase
MRYAYCTLPCFFRNCRHLVDQVKSDLTPIYYSHSWLTSMKFATALPQIGLFFSIVLLASCGGGADGTPQASAYRVDCPADSNYVPVLSAIEKPSTIGNSDKSFILMHGLSGSPNFSLLVELSGRLADAGFDVISPYMPWGRNRALGSDPLWNGSYCDAVDYVNKLVEQEAEKGKRVYIGGHSMGGAHALIYGATVTHEAVKGLIVIAPGHWPHISRLIRDATADDIDTAKNLISQGLGDQTAIFETYNFEGEEVLEALPEHFLSYHDLAEYPDIRSVLPAISLPVLWLVGVQDSLVNLYSNSSFGVHFG